MTLAEAFDHLADALRSTRDAKAFVLVVAELDRLRAIERAAWAVRDSQPETDVRHKVAQIILGGAS